MKKLVRFYFTRNHVWFIICIGFIISLNGEKLDFNKFHGVTNKKISFGSIPKSRAGRNDLQVTIAKNSIMKTIKQNYDPKNGLLENTLLDISLPYVKYSKYRQFFF